MRRRNYFVLHFFTIFAAIWVADFSQSIGLKVIEQKFLLHLILLPFGTLEPLLSFTDHVHQQIELRKSLLNSSSLLLLLFFSDVVEEGSKIPVLDITLERSDLLRGSVPVRIELGLSFCVGGREKIIVLLRLGLVVLYRLGWVFLESLGLALVLRVALPALNGWKNHSFVNRGPLLILGLFFI